MVVACALYIEHTILNVKECCDIVVNRKKNGQNVGFIVVKSTKQILMIDIKRKCAFNNMTSSH